MSDDKPEQSWQIVFDFDLKQDLKDFPNLTTYLDTHFKKGDKEDLLLNTQKTSKSSDEHEKYLDHEFIATNIVPAAGIHKGCFIISPYCVTEEYEQRVSKIKESEYSLLLRFARLLLTNISFDKACLEFRGETDILGFDLLTHFKKRNWKDECDRLLGVYSKFAFNLIEGEIGSLMQQYELRKWLSNEVKRLSTLPLLGEATSKRVTRLDYLINFVTTVSELAEKGSISGLRYNGKEVTGKQQIILWFLIFNSGHLKDERGAERYFLYLLWKSSINKDESLINEDEVIPIKKEVPHSTKTPRKDSYIHQHSASQYADRILKDPSCEQFLEGFPQAMKKYAVNIISSSDWNHFYRVLAVWRILKDDDLGADSKNFLLKHAENFVEQQIEESVFKKSFYMLRQIVYLMTDPPIQSLFTINMQSFINTITNSVDFLKQLYDGVDERSVLLKAENEFYLNESLMSPKYAETMLRCLKLYKHKSKKLELSLFTESIFDETNEQPSEVSSELTISSGLDSEDEECAPLDTRKATICPPGDSTVVDTTLKYFCTITFPSNEKGDFRTYRIIQNDSQLENIYVQQWVGEEQKDTFSNCYLFFEPSIPQLHSILDLSCQEWEKQYNSCYEGLKSAYDKWFIPISTSINSLVQFMLETIVGKNYSFLPKPSVLKSHSFWTVCKGNAEGARSVADYNYSMSKSTLKKNNEDFEAFCLQNAFQKILNHTNEPQIFLILWGGISIQKDMSKQEFDMCWFEISQKELNLFLGEAKSGSENSRKALLKKMNTLGFCDYLFKIESQPMSVVKFTNSKTIPAQLAKQERILFQNNAMVGELSRFGFDDKLVNKEFCGFDKAKAVGRIYCSYTEGSTRMYQTGTAFCISDSLLLTATDLQKESNRKFFIDFNYISELELFNPNNSEIKELEIVNQMGEISLLKFKNGYKHNAFFTLNYENQIWNDMFVIGIPDKISKHDDIYELLLVDESKKFEVFFNILDKIGGFERKVISKGAMVGNTNTHKCPTLPGFRGGPCLIKDDKPSSVIGIHMGVVGEFNTWVPVSDFKELIENEQTQESHNNQKCIDEKECLPLWFLTLNQ